MKRMKTTLLIMTIIGLLTAGVVSQAAAAGTDVLFTYQPGGNMGMPAADALPIRLGLLTLDPADEGPKPHVDYALRVTDSDGQAVFAGGPFHEHEGRFEAVIGPLPAGTYTVEVKAEPTMDTPEELHFPAIEKSFSMDVMEFEAAGSANLDISLPDAPEAGIGTELVFSIEDEEGSPIIHTDNMVIITRDDTVVYQATNTHIHTPPFAMTYTFPEPGHYHVYFTSTPTPMRASVDFPVTSLRVDVDVQ